MKITPPTFITIIIYSLLGLVLIAFNLSFFNEATIAKLLSFSPSICLAAVVGKISKSIKTFYLSLVFLSITHFFLYFVICPLFFYFDPREFFPPTINFFLVFPFPSHQTPRLITGGILVPLIFSILWAISMAIIARYVLTRWKRILKSILGSVFVFTFFSIIHLCLFWDSLNIGIITPMFILKDLLVFWSLLFIFPSFFVCLFYDLNDLKIETLALLAEKNQFLRQRSNAKKKHKNLTL